MKHLSQVQAVPPSRWRKTRDLARALTVCAVAASYMGLASAVGLPAGGDAAPTTTQGWLEWMRNGWGMLFGVLALVVVGYTFLSVGSSALAKFHEWRQGRAEIADFKNVIIVGILLIAFVVFVATQAVGLIASGGTMAAGGGGG